MNASNYFVFENTTKALRFVEHLMDLSHFKHVHLKIKSHNRLKPKKFFFFFVENCSTPARVNRHCESEKSTK